MTILGMRREEELKSRCKARIAQLLVSYRSVATCTEESPSHFLVYTVHGRLRDFATLLLSANGVRERSRTVREQFGKRGSLKKMYIRLHTGTMN